MSDTWIAAIFGIGGVLLGSGIAFFGQWLTLRAENSRWKTEKKLEVLTKRKIDLVKVLAQINQFIHSDTKTNFEIMGSLLASDQELLKMILDFQNVFRDQIDAARRDKLDGKTVDVNSTIDDSTSQFTNLMVEISSKIYAIEKEIDELIGKS